jgi:hypothetical protein
MPVLDPELSFELPVFEARDLAAFQIDVGLIVQHQVIALDGHSQLVLYIHALQGFVHGVVVKLLAVAAP